MRARRLFNDAKDHLCSQMEYLRFNAKTGGANRKMETPQKQPSVPGQLVPFVDLLSPNLVTGATFLEAGSCSNRGNMSKRLFTAGS